MPDTRNFAHNTRVERNGETGNDQRDRVDLFTGGKEQKPQNTEADKDEACQLQVAERGKALADGIVQKVEFRRDHEIDRQQLDEATKRNARAKCE